MLRACRTCLTVIGVRLGALWPRVGVGPGPCVPRSRGALAVATRRAAACRRALPVIDTACGPSRACSLPPAL